jgi:transcriptional regulator with XRE-family HTH domain
MSFDYISLGKNIKRHREKNHMKVSELADVVDCTDTHIRQIEKGNNKPSLEVTVAIANALNIGVDQLVYGDLVNNTNYLNSEVIPLVESLTGNNKKISIELFKAITNILREFEEKVE